MNGGFTPGSGGAAYISTQERGEMKPHPMSGVPEMRVKVLILAILASVVALPVPASQMLSGPISAPSPAAGRVTGAEFSLLIADPFLMDTVSLDRSLSHVELGALLEAAAI